MKYKSNIFLILIFLLILIFFINTTRAETQIIKTDTNYELRERITTNGYPSNNIICNVSIENPIGNLIINNKMMTNNFQLHNFTISGELINTTGEYPCNIYCSDSVIDANSSGSCNFIATPTGELLSDSGSMIYIGIIVLSLIFFSFSMYGAIKIPFKNIRMSDNVFNINDLKYVKILLWFSSYLLLMWIVFMGWNLSANYLFLSIATQFLQGLWFFLIAFLFPIIIVFTLTGILSFLNDKKLKKFARRGLPLR